VAIIKERKLKRKNIMKKATQDIVREKYGSVATSNLSSENDGVRAVAEAFGYSAQELGSIPADSNMGLSCGNPTAMASIKSGETVVDLGSGGGLDVFLAAQKVGPTGRAIGIDMTPEMLSRARKSASEGGYKNAEFHQSTIDKIPLPDSTVDCIISNCVINLAPDKNAVFKEMFRVLKPGGRVAVSDIALKKELPQELAKDIMAYVGCIAGAILIDEYTSGLHQAGFDAVHVQDSGANLNAYSKVEGQAACCSPKMGEKPVSLTVGEASCCGGPSKGCCTPAAEPSTVHEDISSVLSRYDVNEYAASVKVFAVKP
jgi:SAM-dependent methyltransferase